MFSRYENLYLLYYIKIYKTFLKIIFYFKIILFIIINLKIIIAEKKLSKNLIISNNALSLEMNLSSYKIINKKIRIAFYTYSLKGGGTERLTSLFINYFSKIKIFNIFLFTQSPKEANEFIIPINVRRKFIEGGIIRNVIKELLKKRIEIFIYQFPKGNEIEILNNLNNTKIIFYENSCFLYWIYFDYFSFKSIYNSYKNSKYVISLIPFENDYLFKKWGINSILMDNFITYEYNNVIPSDLSSQNIIMIGRTNDRMKRFQLGVESMKYITKEMPKSKMIIISNLNYIDYLKNLVNLWELQKNVIFVNYSSTPEIYYKNSSLHIFPSISESFGLVLSEIKIYGIPTILVGLDYISLSIGGTVIIYDNNSKSIAKEAIKILKDKIYRKKLGKDARKSMRKFKNELILKKWIKIILSIYNNTNYFQKLREHSNKISYKAYINILNNQINLLKMKIKKFKNITIKNIENFTFMNKIELN